MAKPPAKTSKSCFFITPIGASDSPERRRADWIFHHVIEPVSEKLGLDAERADLMSGSAMISTNIFKAISEAPACVADLTGLNPNVFYEIGVRHSLKLPIIHLAQQGTALPFDTAPHLTHFYDLADYNSMAATKEFLAKEMKLVTEKEYVVSNPFTHALGNIEISRSGDPKDQVIVVMEERIRRLEKQLNSNATTNRPKERNPFNDLYDIIETSIVKNETSHINPTFIDNAIRNLPPWRDDEASKLMTLLNDNRNVITNGDYIMESLRAHFPQASPY